MYQRHYMCGVSLLLSTVVFLSAGCGKKGPLIYPDMLIAQAPKNITLEQTGSALRISFDMPEKDQSGHKLEDLEAFLIARRVYRESDSISCKDNFLDLHKIDLVDPSPVFRQGNRIVWVDTDTHRGERYQYQLKTVQKGGMRGQAVSTALATVLDPPDPPLLKAHSAFGGFIQIDLTAALQPDTSLTGFSLYRSEGADVQVKLLASLTNSVSRYEDQSVQRGVVYRYVARMLVKRMDGVIAESELSAPVSLSVSDDPH